MIPGYRRITDAVHAHDTPIFAQINHNGGQGSSMYSRLPLWAPSPVADPLFREVPKEVDRLEIAEIVAGVPQLRRLPLQGRGFDGIEAPVLAQLDRPARSISPAMNTRSDEGTAAQLDNRARTCCS